MTQFYDIVADIDQYKHFVPWCVASQCFQKSETHARANLEVGFPPISEKYTSVLTFARPNLVKVCLYLYIQNYVLVMFTLEVLLDSLKQRFVYTCVFKKTFLFHLL